MGSRVPVQHYNLRSANSFLGNSLHDLNTVDSRTGDIDAINGVDRDAVTDSSLDNDDDSNVVDCMQNSYQNTLPLHGVDGGQDHTSLINGGSPREPYDMFTADDITPIETARARFLQIIVDYFLSEHVVEVADSEANSDSQSEQDKPGKRKAREIRCEGDPRFALPLMYVANMYETLVNDVNIRLASLNIMREKTIGVSLEAAGGLYRKLANKFPRKGPFFFKRRELATSLETRTRFPELVIQEEKRVRFVVINGLDIVERPNTVPINDAKWFKQLTGRNEVAVSAQDYKFYSPRHKYRRNPVSSISLLPAFSVTDNSSVMADAQGFRSGNENLPKHHMHPQSHPPQFHPIQQNHHQTIHQGQHPAQFPQSHQCMPPVQIPEIAQSHHSPTITQHMACLQPLAGGHVGGRLHVMASPAKFCDECGAPYLRETSKFCSECGFKRSGT